LKSTLKKHPQQKKPANGIEPLRFMVQYAGRAGDALIELRDGAAAGDSPGFELHLNFIAGIGDCKSGNHNLIMQQH
jgi:hypothetical protein